MDSVESTSVSPINSELLLCCDEKEPTTDEGQLQKFNNCSDNLSRVEGGERGQKVYSSVELRTARKKSGRRWLGETQNVFRSFFPSQAMMLETACEDVQKHEQAGVSDQPSAGGSTVDSTDILDVKMEAKSCLTSDSLGGTEASSCPLESSATSSSKGRERKPTNSRTELMRVMKAERMRQELIQEVTFCICFFLAESNFSSLLCTDLRYRVGLPPRPPAGYSGLV